MSRNKKEKQLNWRPNFNIPATLPDIKVIRTDFVINFIALTCAMIVGLYALQREYKIYSLDVTVGAMQQRIQAAGMYDNLNLAMSERFKGASRDVIELEKFFGSPIVAHEFLVQLTELKPEGLIFNMVTVSERVGKKGSVSTVEYLLSISGVVKDPLMLGDFKTAFEQSDLLERSDFESEINESLQSRDPKTGIFPYRLMVTLRATNAATAKQEGLEE